MRICPKIHRAEGNRKPSSRRGSRGSGMACLRFTADGLEGMMRRQQPSFQWASTIDPGAIRVHFPGDMSVKHSTRLLSLALSIALLVPASARAADYQRGFLLYGNHCQACHAKTLHVSETRTVKTLSELRKRVAGWAEHAGDDWGKSEIGDVVHYLNRRYYHLAR